VVKDFAEIYTLGNEVMPSTHSYMKVQFGTRKHDGLEVVVKLRFKPKCFRSREDERSWRQNTEFLLSMPTYAGVAQLHEVIEDPTAFYIVMERVDGLDMFETLEAGKMDKGATKGILRRLLVSLVHMHSHNAVHKDLKLENVMLGGPGDDADSGPHVKVIDFDTLEEWTPSAAVCRDVVGTDQYISQEAYAGRYSPLSDVFAVGVIAYRLLSGRFPFQDRMFDDGPGENWVGGPKMEQIRRRLKVAKINFTYPAFEEDPEAMDLVMRMLASAPAQRPTAMAALLHPWMREESDGCQASWAGAEVRNQFEDLIDDGIIIAD